MEKTKKFHRIYKDFENIHIHMDIRASSSSGSQYQMSLTCPDAKVEKQFIIDMKLDDLIDLNQKLSTAFRNFAFSEADQKDYVRDLAQVGYDAFLQIYSNREERELFRKLLSYFRSATIEITTPDFFLPW